MVLLLSGSTLMAQPKDAIENRRNNWLITQAFAVLDSDKSLSLDSEELKSTSGLMNFFSSRDGFRTTDTDKDKTLSMPELMKMSKRAVEFTKKNDATVYDAVMKNKKVAKGAIGYLIRKEELTDRLFTNPQWISENKAIVGKLLSSSKFLEKRPQVIGTLLNNKRALMSNPDLIKTILGNADVMALFPDFQNTGSQLTSFLGSEKEVLLKRMQQGKDKIDKMKDNMQKQ